MSAPNPLTERLRPYTGKLVASADAGNANAQEVISLYEMYCACPSDPGAPALCGAAFDAWLKEMEE